MTLRVGIVSPTFGSYGGLEAFVLSLGAGLPASSGIEARIFFKQAAGFRLQPDMKTAVESSGTRCEFLPRGSRALWHAVQLSRVVHVQHPSPDVFLFARMLRRPLLITFLSPRIPGNSPRQRLWDFCRRHADRRFYGSEFIRRSWEGPTVRPGSRVVFPISQLAGNPSPAASRRGFVFVGRWIPGKGVDTLIEAYALARLDPQRWPLLVIGDGPLRPKIENQVRGLQLAGVTLGGFLLGEDKAAAIRSARFMVVPSNWNEGFGLVAIEARHLGVPCIITRDGGLPEAAGAEALSCEPGDVAGLAACLRSAAAMPEAEYASRSERTYRSLLPTLVGPSAYAEVYRQMAGPPCP